MERGTQLQRRLESCGKGWSSTERTGGLWRGLKFQGEVWSTVLRSEVLWRGLEVCGESWSSVERTGGLWRGLEFCREGWRSVERARILQRRCRSILEKRSERQITPRLSDKASRSHISLYLPEILCNRCKYIYAYTCHKAYITQADNDPHLNHSLTNATDTRTPF